MWTQQAFQAFDHDFPSWATGVIIPHGIYDLARNRGHINIGLSHDTSQFACDSFRWYWNRIGQRCYPDATSILLLCDCGGSNSAAQYLFKHDLQDLVNDLGIEIRVAHYPSYCSKFNPIERRFFPHVARACQGMLFDTLDTVVRLMRKASTTTGLQTTVNVIRRVYEIGRKVADDFKATMPTIDYPENGTPGEGLAVENNYGHAARAWPDFQWSIATDATVNSGTTMRYLGGSGSGSDTGMTQTGGAGGDWGIAYGTHRNFIVQFDATQTSDRVDVTVGGVAGTISDPSNLSIFFRISEHASYPEIGLYNPGPGIGEVNTGLTSGIPWIGEWHNYAVHFDLDQRSLEVFVDEVSRGTINLNTVGGGKFAGLTLSGAAVSVGYAAPDRFWTDNFQIGTPVGYVPEIPGDANRDERVDDVDASILGSHWLLGSGATWENGDFNGDHAVNDADAAIMAAYWHYGVEGGVAGEASVPEPAPAVLLSGLLAYLLFRRREVFA